MDRSTVFGLVESLLAAAGFTGSVTLRHCVAPSAARQRRNCRSAALLATTALVAVTAFAPGAARAQDATWTGATGNFNLGANWDTNTVPTGTAFFGCVRHQQPDVLGCHRGRRLDI